MKAVYETAAGYGAIDGVSDDVFEAVNEVLRRVEDDVFQIWIDEDGASREASTYVFETPDWKLEHVWITRADGKIAKVWMGAYSCDDVWGALQREFPITYPMVIEEALELPASVDYHGWDECFFPGDDSGFAQWYEEGEA